LYPYVTFIFSAKQYQCSSELSGNLANHKLITIMNYGGRFLSYNYWQHFSTFLIRLCNIFLEFSLMCMPIVTFFRFILVNIEWRLKQLQMKRQLTARDVLPSHSLDFSSFCYIFVGITTWCMADIFKHSRQIALQVIISYYKYIVKTKHVMGLRMFLRTREKVQLRPALSLATMNM
jgi:hypothetical protein